MLKFNKIICCISKSYCDFSLNFGQKTKFKNLVLSRSCGIKYASTTSVLLTNQTDEKSFKTFSELNTYMSSKVYDGYKIFMEECEKLKEERKGFWENEDFKIRDPRHTVDMLFTFESENSLNNFVVSTDSSNNAGFSSASLKITQNKTALFSGHISTELPKTGNVDNAGFANMMSLRKMKPFFRPGHYDWRRYTHLVLKVRGDGRTYLVVLPCPPATDSKEHELSNVIYMYPLFTRGGPYWQVTKLPFSHFFCLNKARIIDLQSYIPLNYIGKVGITIGDGIDGPFKLEIDYIGLEMMPIHKEISPYESYYVGKYY